MWMMINICVDNTKGVAILGVFAESANFPVIGTLSSDTVWMVGYNIVVMK